MGFFDLFKSYGKKQKQKETEIKKLENKLADLDNQYKKKKQELENKLADSLKEKRELKKALEEKITKLKVELEKKEKEAKEILRELNGELKKAKEKLEGLNKEKTTLKREIPGKKSELENLKTQIESLRASVKKEEQKQKAQKEKSEKAKDKLQDLYNIVKYYDRYMSVSKKTRDKLENLIRAEDIGSFTTCCYQLSTMDDIWDFVNVELRNGNLESEDCKILGEIFTYFIEQKNKMYRDPLYRVYIPEEGEYFDATKHLDVDRSGADRVKEVVFPGYGMLESKTDSSQPEEKRKIKKMKKLSIVKTM